LAWYYVNNAKSKPTATTANRNAAVICAARPTRTKHCNPYLVNI
jgi:hypothetical protein